MSNNRTDNVENLSEMFGALSNPNRLRLFLTVADCCDGKSTCSTESMGACVGELAEGLDLAKSTVSHHLKELRRTGIITMHRKGRNVECRVNAVAIDQLIALLGELATPDDS